MRTGAGSRAAWCVLAACAAARGAANEGAAVESRIEEVTVYADRAQVVRAAEVTVPAGPAAFTFRRLPGWVDAGSVRVAVDPPAAGSIADVQTWRTYLAETADEDVRAVRSAVLECEDKLGALDDELKALDAQAAQVESIRVFSLEKLPRDAAVRPVEVGEYGKVVEFVGAATARIAAARREVSVRRRAIEPELAARRRKLADLERLSGLEETCIMVSVAGAQAGAAALRLTYLLPGATWEPQHELRAHRETPGEVALASFAVVTQTTGEDWRGARLSFSTQSPDETIQIPEADALLLGGGAVAAGLRQGRTSSFQAAQAQFAGKNLLWYNTFNPDVALDDLRRNWDDQKNAQGRTEAVFGSLQKRGTTAHFAAREPAAVRSDGRPVRVRIGDVRLAAEERVVAVPRVSLNAARTLKAGNGGEQPILPGKVRLYRDGAFVGLTDVDFVARGESFSLFAGVADRIKLSRMLDRQRSSLVRGKRTRMQAAFRIVVENLSDEAVTLELADRVPVSQQREIVVDRVRIEPQVEPEADGIVRWRPTVPAHGEQEFRVEYRIEYPPAAVQDLRRQETEQQGMPAPAEWQLGREIQDLELKF